MGDLRLLPGLAETSVMHDCRTDYVGTVVCVHGSVSNGRRNNTNKCNIHDHCNLDKVSKSPERSCDMCRDGASTLAAFEEGAMVGKEAQAGERGTRAEATCAEMVPPPLLPMSRRGVSPLSTLPEPMVGGDIGTFAAWK
jgi:hypothetical protein